MENDEEYISKDVTVVNLGNSDLTKSPRNVKSDIRKYWHKDELNRMIDQIKNARHQMLIRFLWMSGVRITEAVSLVKGNIDFQHYTMTLRWLKSRKYLQRVVPIHPNLRDLMQVYTAPMNEQDKVFPISRQRAWQVCKKHLNGHPHQLRHSFAVNWLNHGGDLVTLHRILGHSKVQTTMEYLKICPIDQGKELLKIKFN